MPKRRVLPKPMQEPHPPIWGATGGVETHRLVGQMGIGLLSFSVGTPPEDLKKRIDVYREGVKECEQPVGKFINNRAASFSMVHCAETTDEAVKDATESFEWYPRRAGELVASVPAWLEELGETPEGYERLAEHRK